MALPNCNCIGAYTVAEKLTAIYCVILSGISNPVNLPDCNCVSSYTEAAKLDAIYCALLQFTQQEPAAVNINDVEGVSDFWKTSLGETPAADQVFGTNGAGVFTTFPISTFGQDLLAFGEPGADVVLATNNEGNLTGYSITAVGINLLNLSTPPAPESFLMVLNDDSANFRNRVSALDFLADGNSLFTGSQTPVTQIDVFEGFVTNAS